MKQQTNSLKLIDNRPSIEEAEKAIDTIIRFIGEDPTREGIKETPERVIRSFTEFFAGYAQSAEEILSKTFEEMQGYDDIVLVKDIDFVAHCEHHMLPFTGKAHIAYWPEENIVGISKLARIVDVFAKRMTTQEDLSRNILNALDTHLKPKGAAVIINSSHQCMSLRGTQKKQALTTTSVYSGIFKEQSTERSRLMELIKL